MYMDTRGCAVAAAGQESVDRLDACIEAYLGARRDTMDRVQNLLANDPECLLGHCLAGYLQMHRATPEAAASAKDSLSMAVRNFPKLSGHPSSGHRREKLHIESLRTWIEGDLANALQCWEAILSDFPRDILAVRLAQFMTSYLGNSQGIRDSIERVFPKWDEKVPGYNYLLGCYAYALEETGDYGRAERMGRLAVERNPEDLWSAHAVAHVMEMRGRPREGIAWLAENTGHWRNCNNFVFHLKWHAALFHLALADFDRVLEVYDREVRAESTDEYLDIANAASVLWRLEQANVDVGTRWEELAKRTSNHLNDHFFVFADLHYMISAAAAPSSGDAERFLQSCSDFARSDRGTQAQVMDEVGLDIAEAILANRQGRYSDALEHLLSRRNLIRRVGGSHAQRDTFELLLIDSAIRARNYADARMLLVERTSVRPHDLWSWRTWMDLSEAVGNREDAANARARLESLLRNVNPNTAVQVRH